MSYIEKYTYKIHINKKGKQAGTDMQTEGAWKGE